MKVLLFCVISFGLMVLTANLEAQNASTGRSKVLSLRGTVQTVEIKEIDRSSALIEMKLKMELVNVGVRPIIFLKREPLFPGGALARTPDDFEVGNVLAADAGWPSNDIAPEWAALRVSLDRPNPPSSETKILAPNESWFLETSIRIVVPTGPKRSTSSRKKETLATIQELSPVWLRVVCDLWPWNVEPLTADHRKLRFGHKLQQRWKQSGLLWLDVIYSEPIKLDLKK